MENMNVLKHLGENSGITLKNLNVLLNYFWKWLSAMRFNRILVLKKFDKNIYKMIS